MKHLNKIIAIILVIFTAFGVYSQGLTDLHLRAHFTLQDTDDDLLRNYTSATLKNAPFNGDEGVYSNGIYIGNNEDGSLISTPEIEEFEQDKYALSIEFKPEKLTSGGNAILMAGNSYRFLGIEYTSNDEFNAIMNGRRYPIPEQTVNINQWDTVHIVYNHADSIAEWFLGEEKVFERKDAIIREEFDKKVSNTHYGNGTSFLGYLRNLKIYGSEELTSSNENSVTDHSITIFTNPIYNQTLSLYSDGMHVHYSIIDIGGRLLRSGILKKGTNSINLIDLEAGIYYLISQSQSQARPFSQAFIVF